jgi:Alkylmercury lyase/Winged helix-turn-helix DNA-binding
MATNDVRVEIYRSFIEDGRAPTSLEIADRLGVSSGDVDRALEDLARDGVIALMPGTHLVWLAHPFSASDALFRVTAGAESWDSMCIWDALGILAMLERDGTVHARCPDCAEPLEVQIDGGRPSSTEMMVHFGVPASRWYEDIGHT